MKCEYADCRHGDHKAAKVVLKSENTMPGRIYWKTMLMMLFVTSPLINLISTKHVNVMGT